MFSLFPFLLVNSFFPPWLLRLNYAPVPGRFVHLTFQTCNAGEVQRISVDLCVYLWSTDVSDKCDQCFVVICSSG